MYPTTTSGRPSLEKSPLLDGSRGQCAMSFHAASSDIPDAPSLSCAIGYWVVSMTLRKPYFHPSVGVSASSGKAAGAAAMLAIALRLRRVTDRPSTYTGSEACRACHAGVVDAWQTSLHHLAMLPAARRGGPVVARDGGLVMTGAALGMSEGVPLTY